MLLLKSHVIKFQDKNEGVDASLQLDEDDWRGLSIYYNSLKSLADNSDMLEGQNYPTASSVIPFLDQVCFVFSHAWGDGISDEGEFAVFEYAVLLQHP